MSARNHISRSCNRGVFRAVWAFLLVGGFLLMPQLYAQNYIRDFSKMYKAYQNLENFHTFLEVVFVEGGTRPVPAQKGEIWKAGDQYRYRLDHLTMLYNDQYILAVDDQTRTIALSERSGENVSALVLIAEDFEAIKEQYEKVEFAGLEDGKLHYRIYTPGNVIVLTEVFLDAKTFLISSLEYDYNPDSYPEGTRATVRYREMNLTPSFAPDVFSESRFIQSSPDGWKPATGFGSYRLLLTPNQPQ